MLAAALLLAPPGAGAQTTSKPYSVVLSPAEIAAGSSATVTARLANLTAQQQLGSAELTAPAGLEVSGARIQGAGTPTVSGRSIRIRDLSLAPGATVDVLIEVSAPCEAAGTATWSVTAKQSNDFKGPPGNDLFLDPSSRLTTTVTGACALAFVTQPQDAQVGAPITGADFDPAGPPVAVAFVDGAGEPVASGEGTVTLALGRKAQADDVLAGVTSADAVQGIAPFASVRVDRAGPTFTIVASSPGAAPVESDPFRVTAIAERCAEDVDCEAELAGRSSSLQATAIADPFATDAGFLLLSQNPGPRLDCPDYEELAGETFTLDETTGARTKLVTLRIDRRAMNAVSNNGVSFLELCFGAPTPFEAKHGPAVAQPHDGAVEYVGLLGDCGAVPAPCVQSRRKDRSGDGLIVSQAPAGDPRYSG